MMRDEPPQQTIDRLYPFHGSCAFCNHPDARHRLIDAVQELLRLGEPIESVADEFGISLELVEAIGRLT